MFIIIKKQEIMKKKLYFSIPFLLIAVVCYFYVNNWSARAKALEHFNELVAQKNDSLFMSEYLSGFHYAGKVEKMADSIAFFRVTEENVNEIFIKLALTVLERTRGVDSTANIIFNSRRLDYDFLCSNDGFRLNPKYWIVDITAIEKASSPSLLMALKMLVTRKKNDPVWMSRHISAKEMLELCLSGSFREKELVVYSDGISIEDKMIIFDKFTDEKIIKYQLGSAIKEKRMLAIASKLERKSIKESYEFLKNSDADERYGKDLIARNINQMSILDLLWYHNEGVISTTFLEKRMSQLSTKILVKDLRNKLPYFYFAYPFRRYAYTVIASIKNSKDAENAFQVIDYFSDEEDKDYLLKVLSVKTASTL